MTNHSAEVSRGERFEFGANWNRFLTTLDDERIHQAERSLKDMLGAADLAGYRFLDVGSGSGLFSLAARRLGAHVRSFDYDPQSVSCTSELRKRYFPEDTMWSVEQGSVLDREYLSGLGRFDVVYSWGVLHHTGAMWQALENVAQLVDGGGTLFIAIYNDQGGASRRWRKLKRWYNKYRLARWPLVGYMLFRHGVSAVLRSYRRLHTRQVPTDYKTHRGMSVWHDLIDWIGGYPFEVAKPEEIFAFYRAKGFRLEKLVTCGGGLGCNQFVFSRER